MSGLPADYLEYPLRKRGMDHDIYAYRALPTTKPVQWPGGARVALWITVHVGLSTGLLFLLTYHVFISYAYQ